jgi:AcrR family transcriptional regulator
MAKAPKQDPSDALIATAMTHFAERGFAGTSFDEIVAEAGVDPMVARRLFGDKTGVLTGAIRVADAAVLAEDAGFTDEESVRDRLFDLLMRRFDALAPHRAGLRAASRDLARDPPVAMRVLLSEGRAFAWYLEAAGTSTDGPIGALRVKGLGLVWARVLRIWHEDDSDDFAKTMAALDKDLGRAEQVAGWLSGRPRRRDPDAEPDAPASP